LRLIKYRYYFAFAFISAVIIGLSYCTSSNPEENTILLATNTRPLRDIKFKSTPERIKRGQYLTNSILQCFLCHSPRDTTKPGCPPVESRKGAGAILTETKEYRMVAPNITPDKKTGAGNWSDDVFARAIREGIGQDGRALSLPMYWRSFSELSDEDLASIVVYLRTLPAVKNKLPKRKLSIEKEKQLQSKSRPLLHPVPTTDLSDVLTRGRYLVKVADCVGCHTGFYKRNPGLFGGGNKLQRLNDTSYVFSSNITPDATGLKGWTPEIFTNVIRTGKGGAFDPVMPWVAYMNLSDEDLKAILLALQQVPTIQHKVINGIEPGYCEVCEQSHGFGQYNKIIPLRRVPFNQSLYPEFVGKYIHPLGFTMNVKLEDGKLFISEGGPNQLELVYVGDNRFQALGLSTPVSFKRDATRKVTGLISYWIEEDFFRKEETRKTK
jgi:mono/diheme cytochrome c family protein